jgi:hypothetical protein
MPLGTHEGKTQWTSEGAAAKEGKGVPAKVFRLAYGVIRTLFSHQRPFRRNPDHSFLLQLDRALPFWGL